MSTHLPAKLAATAALLLGISTVAGGGTYAAFSSTTENSGNTFAAGTVTLTDNDGTPGTAMFTMNNVRPGSTDTACIQVSYTGSVPTTSVRLHGTTTTTSASSLAPHLNVVVTRGTETNPTFDNCATFAADTTVHVAGQAAGVIYNGPLSGFPTTAAPYTDPTADWLPAAQNKRSYRFVVTVADNNAAQGLNATTAFTWTASS